MGWKACAYARKITSDPGCGLSPTARSVLMYLAEAASNHTGLTYTGDELERCTGWTRPTVTRAVNELLAAGVIAAEKRSGRATIVRFPVASPLSTTVASAQPFAVAKQSTTVAPAQPTCAPGARVPVNYPSVTTSARSTHDAAGCSCTGDGWIYDPASRSSRRCPADHHGEAVGQ